MKSPATQRAAITRTNVLTTVPAACCVMWPAAAPAAMGLWYAAAWNAAHQQVQADARRRRLMGHVEPSLN